MTKEPEVTDEQIKSYDRFLGIGGQPAMTAGAQWMLDFQAGKREYQEVLNLAIGQLQAACYVFRTVATHSKPKDVRNVLVQEVAQLCFEDLLLATKDETDEQCGADEDTSKDSEETVQGTRCEAGVPEGNGTVGVGDDEDVHSTT